MKRDEILAIARELGFDDKWRGGYMTYDEIVAFASRIESLVREECAKICGEIAEANMDSEESVGAVWCEERLRDSCAIRKSEG
jgi:hypothetical protein